MRLDSSLGLPALLSSALWLCVSVTAADVKAPRDVKWIEDAGGKVIRDAAGRITGIDLRGSWVTDTDLRELVHLPDLTHLDLSLTRITDQGMQELKNAPGIVGYNDDDDRTHEEILAVWDKAIEIERGRAVTVVKNGRFFYRPNGDEPESVSEALTLARQMIEDEGHWATGVDFKNPGYKDDPSTPFCNGWGACARGAVVAVTLGVYDSYGGYPNDTFRNWRAPAEEVPSYNVDPSYGLRYLAHRALKYLDRAASKAGHAGGIVSLNDKSGTKHALVLECFDTAIALAKADEDKVTAPSEA